MSEPLITIAPDEAGKSFLQGPVLFQHRFSDHPLFSDEGLAGIIDGHPDDMIDFNINRFNEAGQVTKLLTGDRNGMPGADVLRAIGRGEMWVNLRYVNDTHPEISALMQEMQAALEAHNKRFRGAKLHTNLLISAPNAKVPYHADQPEVMLCHVRGAKRIWVYPNGGKHLPDEHFEKVVLKETTEDLPYNRSYDEDAKVFDLAPGQAIAWPPNAPHRVENLGTVNVSLSIEYMTWDSRQRLGAYYVNGLLRRLGFSVQPVAKLGPIGVAARWALSVPLKRLGLHKGNQMVFAREFEVAPDAEEGVRQRA
jgi:hypothetical protein